LLSGLAPLRPSAIGRMGSAPLRFGRVGSAPPQSWSLLRAQLPRAACLTRAARQHRPAPRLPLNRLPLAPASLSLHAGSLSLVGQQCWGAHLPLLRAALLYLRSFALQSRGLPSGESNVRDSRDAAGHCQGACHSELGCMQAYCAAVRLKQSIMLSTPLPGRARALWQSDWGNGLGKVHGRDGSCLAPLTPCMASEWGPGFQPRSSGLACVRLSVRASRAWRPGRSSPRPRTSPLTLLSPSRLACNMQGCGCVLPRWRALMRGNMYGSGARTAGQSCLSLQRSKGQACRGVCSAPIYHISSSALPTPSHHGRVRLRRRRP